MQHNTGYIKNITFLVIGLVVGWLLWGHQPSVVEPTPEETTQSTDTKSTVGLGEHCGGNMSTAAICAVGFHCAPTAGSHLPFGDVGGTCVED